MKHWLRDIGICLGTAIFVHLILIGPFLAFMIVTGGAVFAVPFIAILALVALILDWRVLRRAAYRGWPFTAAALGLTLNVTFLVATTPDVT